MVTVMLGYLPEPPSFTFFSGLLFNIAKLHAALEKSLPRVKFYLPDTPILEQYLFKSRQKAVCCHLCCRLLGDFLRFVNKTKNIIANFRLASEIIKSINVPRNAETKVEN